MELTPTGWSILGFLSLQERNGYEIRQAARRSVEAFWGVSDGQLYPQLRRLRDLGLIAPAEPAAGGRGAATTWRLTDAGRAALHGWLRAPSAPARSRDENLVKLMFADELGPAAVLELLGRRRSSLRAARDRVMEIKPGAHRHGDDERLGRVGPRLVHEYTLYSLDAAIGWCDRAIAELGERKET